MLYNCEDGRPSYRDLAYELKKNLFTYNLILKFINKHVKFQLFNRKMLTVMRFLRRGDE